MLSSNACRFWCGIWLLVSVTGTAIIAVITSVAIRYTTSGGKGYYPPMSTQIIPLSNLFCQSLNVTVLELSYDNTVSFYLLDSPPELTGRKLVYDWDTDARFGEEILHYHYGMHPGSHFTVAACLKHDYDLLYFFLIKGNRDFERWNRHYSEGGIGAVVESRTLNITANCNFSSDTFHYRVRQDGSYHLVFAGKTHFDENDSDTHNISIRYSLTYYKPSQYHSVISSCHLQHPSDIIHTQTTCSLDIPLHGTSGFLVLNGDGIDGLISIVCAPRMLAYAVLSVSTLVVVAVVTTVVIVACAFKSKKSMQDASPLLSGPAINRRHQQRAPISTYGGT